MCLRVSTKKVLNEKHEDQDQDKNDNVVLISKNFTRSSSNLRMVQLTHREKL